MGLRASLLFLLAVCTATNINAETSLSGDDRAEFQQAVEFWLDDNDEKSLPVFSALARDGNLAARILLARIDFTDRAAKPFVTELTRDQHRDLFRAESSNSQFRPSWLKIEADRGQPLALALFKSTTGVIDFWLIKELYQLGEIEATEHLVRKVAVDGSPAEREALGKILHPGSVLAPYLRGFHMARSDMTSNKTELQYIIASNQGIDPELVELDQHPNTKTAEKYVDYGYQSGKQTIGDWNRGRHYDAIARWTLSAPRALPLARLCRRACAADRLAACAVTAFGLVGGYYEVIRFYSPLETIISQDRFLQSERASGMVARRIAAARTEAGEPIFSAREFSAKSACLAKAISSLQ